MDQKEFQRQQLETNKAVLFYSRITGFSTAISATIALCYLLLAA